MRVIAYTIESHDDGQITIRESTGQSITSSEIDKLFDWLMVAYKPVPDALFVAWDLGDFAAPLLRKLGVECCEELAGPNHKTKIPDPYKVFFRYRPESGGVLGIDKGYKIATASIYSLNQFFPKDTPDPETAEEIQAYGDDLVRLLASVGLEPSKLTSAVAAYLSCVNLPLPLYKDASESEKMAGDYAFHCTSKEWRDCYQVGHWEASECEEYDLTNAYAAVAARMPNTRDAEYLHSTEYVEGAYWGFLKGRVTINDDVLVSPIMRTMADGAWGTPVGSWDTYLTLHEVKFIERWGIGHFELEDGWFLK